MEKKKRKWPKVLGITLLVIALVIVIVGVGGYLYLRHEYGSTPEVSLKTDDDTTVNTTGGIVIGGIDDGVYTYLGLPYATVGERFMPAKDASWDGVYEATNYGNISPQQSFFGSDNQDEDCLNLNIWTNGINDGGNRPVMVWFHGGGMTTGSANENATQGRNLAADEDVVVVTVNHRLGALAFLDLAEYDAKYSNSGNVGVLDMIDSLKWVHNNIASFGGDPDNVTIFGQSGGGAKVLALMTSPNAKGLFQKGINQSGATDTLGPAFSTKEISQRVAELTLDELDISESNIEDLQTVSFEELNSAGTNALQQVAEEFQIESPFGGSYSFEWMPVVDGNIIPSNPVTEDGFAENAFDIPLLIGSNLNEWSFMGGSTNATDEIIAAFSVAYPNVDANDAASVDAMLRVPLKKIASHKADQGGAPVYTYVMTYGSPNATHGAEIPLIFKNVDEADTDMSNIMSAIWAQFARTGNPSIDSIPEWEAFTRDNGATMILDADSYMAYHHDDELLELLKPGYEY